MGAGMAKNLLVWCQANGHTLTVFDIDQSRVDPIVELGATSSSSIKAMSSKLDIVFTSVPTHEEVELVAAYSLSYQIIQM